MKRVIVIILCSPFLLFSQDGIYDHQFKWNSSFLFESNSLNKNFLNMFMYGGYITDDMKTEWINSEGEKNIIYAEISNGLNYNYHSKKQSFGFSFFDRNILNTKCNDDFLRISFEGNYNYQNEILNFDNTNIRADRFQQYKFSYGAKIKRNKIFSSISYLKGNHHLSYIIEKGSLYTAPFGTYLDIAYEMNAFITDTSNLTPFANNGNGIAIDLGTSLSFKNYDLHLSISDLGFIMWDPSSITLATDSSFYFQGVVVEDIFNFNDSVLEANNITDDILKTNTTSFKSYIPATLNLSISGEMQNIYLQTYTIGIIAKWQPYQDDMPLDIAKIEQGFKQSNYMPLYYITSKVYGKNFTLLPSISYGGYTEDTNIGLAIFRGKKNRFALGTQHLEDLINDDNATAFSIYLNMIIQF